MKTFFLTLLLTVVFLKAMSQTVVYNDNMESSGYTWKGVPKSLLNSYYTGGNSTVSDNPPNSPLYSSYDSCFAVFGTGLGSSAIEKDTLSFPNVTGLNPGTYYQIRFKVCSIGISPATNAAAGVDGGDYVQIEYSSNGGLTYFKELKFVGASNSMWGFSGGITAGKNASGALSTITYSPSSPVTALTLNLPLGTTQLALNLIMAANASGETWMVDDVQLVAVTALPIELVSFTGERQDPRVMLKWVTASETNNDYFTVYSSTDAIEYENIGTVPGAGNSTAVQEYVLYDESPSEGVVYYRICQTDFDGATECFDPIAIRCGYKEEKKVVRKVNMLGQDVDETFEGCVIILYEDGSSEKGFQ